MAFVAGTVMIFMKKLNIIYFQLFCILYTKWNLDMLIEIILVGNFQDMAQKITEMVKRIERF